MSSSRSASVSSSRLVTILPAIGRPDELVDSPDAVYHLNRIRLFLDTGNFSIVHPTFYPNGFHAWIATGLQSGAAPGPSRDERRDRDPRGRRVAGRRRHAGPSRAGHVPHHHVCRWAGFRGLRVLPDHPPRVGGPVAQPHGHGPHARRSGDHAPGRAGHEGRLRRGQWLGFAAPCPAWPSSSPTPSSPSWSSPSSGSSRRDCARGSSAMRHGRPWRVTSARSRSPGSSASWSLRSSPSASPRPSPTSGRGRSRCGTPSSRWWADGCRSPSSSGVYSG